MSLFTKMFGKKVADDETAAEPQGVDFTTALSMHLRGEVDPALATYIGIIEKVPGDTLALFFAAAIKAEKGNVVEAAENLCSLSRDISSTGENISRAIAMELAAVLSNESIPFRIPAVAEIVVSFGDRLKKEGFVRESAVCFEIATGLVPDNAHMLHKLGDTLHDLRIYDYAESVLLEALKYAPSHWGALYTYAVLLQDLGRNDEAITYYERAVKLIPTHVNCQNNYGAALLRVNRLDEALAHCTLAAELDPSAPLVKVNLGYIYSLRQEHEMARTCFTEALSLNNNLGPAYYGLASVEQALAGDPKRIQELYLKAIEINPATPEAHHALGNLLASQGDPQALSHFAAAAQFNNNQRSLHKDFGLACLQLERREEALEHLRIALQQDPDDVMVQDILSRTEAEISGEA